MKASIKAILVRCYRLMVKIKSNYMNILVNGIGGPTPRSIAKQLRIKYPESKIIGIDCNPQALGFYMDNLIDKSYLIPKVSNIEYWNVLNEIIEKEAIDFAFVQPEAEVLAWGKYFKDNDSYPCPTIIPPLEYTENLMDKARMAELLDDTTFIPRTIVITPKEPRYSEVRDQIGFPCWIRASVGSGGLGSLRLDREDDLRAWLFINKDIEEFTVSEFLVGRHLANQMLYIEGSCIRNAGLHCVEYVMANIAPSKVTGNTSFGRLINDKRLLDFCENVMKEIARKLNVKPHGVYSFDLKEDSNGNLKVTEINIRHMAYTGIMGKAGFDLVQDSVHYLQGKVLSKNEFQFEKDLIFLRDVDIEPILMKESDLLKRFNV